MLLDGELCSLGFHRERGRSAGGGGGKKRKQRNSSTYAAVAHTVRVEKPPDNNFITYIYNMDARGLGYWLGVCKEARVAHRLGGTNAFRLS